MFDSVDTDHAAIDFSPVLAIAPRPPLASTPGPAWREPPPCGVTYGELHCTAMRAFDILAALAGIIVLAPLLMVIGMAVRVDSRGPALFIHRRIGQFGVPFPCLKFRTMVVDADRVLAERLARCRDAHAEWNTSFKLREDPRVTALGRFLRKFSLDELPQLFNILVGHMSVVGPRPIIEAEVVRYGRNFAEYCSVRPGLTGAWQISGRNDLSYEERVSLDARYVRSKTLAGDLIIISRTMQAVMQAQGSY